MPSNPPDDETYLAAESAVPLGNRFTPGTLVAGRFRIVTPLGRGGMGEVYRAEDMKLGHAVALKFLPGRRTVSPAMLDRLRSEVGLGRQVSHPNVCRIYDIGESSEGPFIAMEYVDGEDLASLLRRIGRLPPDKAVEIARDLTAGLAAAHDLGILHRDLKPANVMIDGRGRARITNFGLAVLAGELETGGVASGTPAYMAPEQLAGGRVTARSDIYALGLILYEVFSGRRLFDGRTIEDIRAQHRAAKAPSLSTAVRDVNSAIERVIGRCLEENPSARPASAHAVIAVLPGGDPLAAAVAAGETPSPAMVAAAGQKGDLPPSVAWLVLVATIAAMLVGVLMKTRTETLGTVPLPKSPDVLDERAREIAERLGYTDTPVAAAHDWILSSDDYATYMIGQNSDLRRAPARVRPSPFEFVYRSSTKPMIAWGRERRILADDPPFVQPGMLRIALDPTGRLISFEAIPPQKDSATISAQPEWHLLFDEASIDVSRFHAVPSVWSAPVDVDTKQAWDGTLPEQPDIVVHVEAGAHRDRISWFKVFGPWDVPVPLREPVRPALIRASAIALTFLQSLLLIPALVLAVRNVRRDRGDWRGALRLAYVIAAITVVGRIIRADHAALILPGNPEQGPDEWLVIQSSLAVAAWTGVVTWLVYVALEPYVRRRLPGALVGWSRLLAGRVRDPMVGRDVLIGVLAGAVLSSMEQIARILPAWLGGSTPVPSQFATSPLESARHVPFLLLDFIRINLLQTLVVLFTFVVLRAVCRRQWTAVALTFFVLGVAAVQTVLSPGASIAVALGASAALVAGILYVLLRWGFLASLAGGVVSAWLRLAPFTLDTSSWYFGRSLIFLAACAALAIYGFVVSLGGKPMFGAVLFEE